MLQISIRRGNGTGRVPSPQDAEIWGYSLILMGKSPRFTGLLNNSPGPQATFPPALAPNIHVAEVSRCQKVSMGDSFLHLYVQCLARCIFRVLQGCNPKADQRRDKLRRKADTETLRKASRHRLRGQRV